MSENNATGIDGSLLYRDDEERGRETDVEAGVASDEARAATSTLRKLTHSTTAMEESQGPRATVNQSVHYKSATSNDKRYENIEKEADQPWDYVGVNEQGDDASCKDEGYTKDDTTMDVETGGESEVTSLKNEVGSASIRSDDEDNGDNNVQATPSNGDTPPRNRAARPTPPGAVRILPPGGNPLADWAGSDDEGTQGDEEEDSRGRATIPEALAEYVDHEEEERRMEERVTKRVQDRMIRDAPIADVVTPEEGDGSTRKKARKPRVVLVGIALALFATAVGASLGVILPRKQATEPSEETGTVEPTAAPTAAPTVRPLDELLSSVSFDGGEALRTPSTPQSMAYEWLANNTNLVTYPDRQKIQRYTLAALFFSTNGTDWWENTNWLGDADECGIWKMSQGALVCTDNEEVVELKLHSNNLVGRLPPEIGLLSDSLATLHLGGNDISGSIPTEIGLLTSMARLSIGFLYGPGGNKLSGSVPTEIGLLTAMTSLNLDENQLSGSIPSEIGGLTALTNLYLNENQLSGSVPSEVGLLTGMTRLDLDHNQLSGPIPSEIGGLTAMRRLGLFMNQLSGSIPSEIGLLTDMYLLDLYINQLSGSLPTEIGHLTALNVLDLSTNQLTGTIPSFFHNMTNLEELYLYDNKFTGNFTCPGFIEYCGISCKEWWNHTCRSL